MLNNMGLGKDFTRAIANQVIIDANKNANRSIHNEHENLIPIRVINNTNFYYIRENRNTSYDEAIQVLKSEGFIVNLKLANLAIPIIIFIFTLWPNFISSTIFIIVGILKITKKNTLYWKYNKVSTYVTDRRYKSGVRHDGFYNEKVKLLMPANYTEKQEYKKRGYLYIGLGLIQLFISIIMLFIFQK